jgi:hypothetical protein
MNRILFSPDADSGLDSMNENTSVSPEPIKGTGTGATSFDELELAHQLPPLEKPASAGPKNDKSPKKETKHANSKKSAKDEDDDEDQQGEQDGDERKERDAAAKEEGDESDDGKDEDKGDEAKDAESGVKRPDEKEKVKTFKVKSGDKEIEVRSDTAFEVSVAGKVERVPVQELLNNYSGKVVWDKKFSELDRDRKSFQAEKQDLQSSVDKLFQLAVQDSNPRAAIEYLAEALGGDPRQVWTQLRDEIKKQFDSYKGLSEDEIRAKETEDELNYLRQKDESAKADAARKQKLSEVEKRTQAVQETHKLSNEEFYRIFNDLKNSGQVDPEDLTPELVGDYYVETSTRKELGSILEGINPELAKKPGLIGELRDTMLKQKLSMEDMRDVITEVYGSKKSKGLAKKLKQSNPTNTSRPSAIRRENPLTFDDIE